MAEFYLTIMIFVSSLGLGTGYGYLIAEYLTLFL